MIYLISPQKKQYKANLHCHSTCSDGKRTPEELKEKYKQKGYDILAITDHEYPRNHTALTDKDFLMITGYECYIRSNPEGKSSPYGKEVHLNLFAKDPNNTKIICYNENYCRYVKRDNALDTLDRAGNERTRELTIPYVNEYIRTAKEYGYLVAYNHPYWSQETITDLLCYEGLFSLEMCNYSSYLGNYLEYNAAIYEELLLAGKRLFCHGSDDNHNSRSWEDPLCDSFGSFTMIMPEEFTYSGVINALEKGEMYASMGPTFREVSIDNGKIHIECSPVRHIFVYYGSKKPSRIHAAKGEYVTSADFEIDSQAKFIRVSIQDEDGNWADTRGFFPDELGL